MLDALDRMTPGDDGTVFTMADMGCVDVGTSLGMVGTVLRRTAPASAVTAAAAGPYRYAAERFQRGVPHGAGIGAPRRDRGPDGLRVGDLVSPADISAGDAQPRHLGNGVARHRRGPVCDFGPCPHGGRDGKRAGRPCGAGASRPGAHPHQPGAGPGAGRPAGPGEFRDRRGGPHPVGGTA